MARQTLIIPLAFASALFAGTAAFAGQDHSEDASVARTRQQVRMLDDLYKTAVVLITEHYVDSPSKLSGASAAKALFAAMAEKGWHEVRLVGLTDTLINPRNAPADAFEREAAARLHAGDDFHEEVVTKDGARHLRYATPVPVVLQRCVMCHPSFEDNPGIIGSLSYTVPLID